MHGYGVEFGAYKRGGLAGGEYMLDARRTSCYARPITSTSAQSKD